MGAIALVAGLGCTNAQIVGGYGGSVGPQGGASGGSGSNGGAGGAVTVLVSPIPDASADRPTGGQCGDGTIERDETCDDGNTVDGDGCSGNCQAIESGYYCPVPGKKCVPVCGDKVVLPPETCDDGNTVDKDGCSSTCQTEPGYDCPTAGQACVKSDCGNGKTEVGEQCDCGNDATKPPSGCKAVNGLFYGDGKGCSKTCTKEPSCLDGSGKTQACAATCGDGNIDPSEECDDGNQADGDGCSSSCKKESGFTCDTSTSQDSSTCQSGSGQCLDLPIIYRDFQPENVSPGGHPDFYWLGAGSPGTITTWCVPNSGGPSKGNDSTARCWGIAASDLVNGKPQPGTTTTCKCQFSDWSVGNVSHIPGGYAQSDSPLYATGGYRADATGRTSNGGPIWSGTTPAYKNAASFKQWFNDDPTVNKTFTGVLELGSIGTNVYQYASKSHLVDGGFFPLDTLNPSQKTVCYMWPYWNTKFFPGCKGDQYLFPPRLDAGDCGVGNAIDSGCWVTNLTSQTHDNYFTDEVRYYFAYDGAIGIALQFFGDDDLFIFINGKLVLDLGGVHQQLPGKVTVTGSPGDATIVEGGCLDAAGNIQGASAGSSACSPKNTTPPTATTPDDFRTRTVALGLETGKIYEIALFGGDRHPSESNYQLTLNGFTTKKSACTPHCGDGIVTNGEQCDCGDGTVPVPAGCPGPNNDNTYGGCTTKCTYGPFCGDEKVQTDNGGSEQCDLGKDNGKVGKDGCTFGCLRPHFCGDEIVDKNEACDLGTRNGQKLDTSLQPSDSPDAIVRCNTDCTIPDGVVF